MKTLHLSIIVVLVLGIGTAYAYSSAGFPETHYPPTNDTKLESLVMNSTEFKEITTGYNHILAGIDYNWIPKANNYYDLGGARVTFIVWGFDNGTVKGVAFNLDPQLKIKNIFEYDADNPPSGYYSDTCHGCFLRNLNSTKPLVEPKTVIEPTLKQLVDAKDAISNMMGSKMLKIPISSVGVDEQNLILDVGINDPNAVMPSIAKEYQTKVQEIVGNLPIQIDYENPVAYGEILKQNSILLPLKQFKSGILANNVTCNQGLELIFKAEDDSPACVTPQTSEKLIERGWTIKIPSINSMTESARTTQTTSCLSQNQTIIPGQFYLPACPPFLFNTITNVTSKSGFVGVYHYSNIFDNFVIKPGHNGTITYSITANHPQYSGSPSGQKIPNELNITNYATFFHQKTIALADIRKYPEINKETGSSPPAYSTCYVIPDSSDKSCNGAQPTGDSVSLFFYDHPGVDVSFDKKSETIGPNGSDTVMMTISVSPHAPTGTYWVEVSPNVCMGGEIFLLTVGDCPYSGDVK